MSRGTGRWQVDQARAVPGRWGRYVSAVVAVSLVTVLLAAVPGASDSSEAPAGPPRAVAGTLSAGGDHACVVVVGGDVKCWGRGLWGKLGDNSTLGVGSGTDGSGEMSGLGVVDLG